MILHNKDLPDRVRVFRGTVLRWLCHAQALVNLPLNISKRKQEQRSDPMPISQAGDAYCFRLPSQVIGVGIGRQGTLYETGTSNSKING